MIVRSHKRIIYRTPPSASTMKCMTCDISETMSRHRPEEECECGDECGDKKHDPDRAPEQQLLHVWVANAQGPERRGLGLPEEDEDWVQLVLVADEEQDGNSERNEELFIFK